MNGIAGVGQAQGVKGDDGTSEKRPLSSTAVRNTYEYVWRMCVLPTEFASVGRGIFRCQRCRYK